MTEKLFYKDNFATQFTATVTDCVAEKDYFAIVLDKTLFYPEGGGQACDMGVLGTATVLDVRERGEEVIHLCDCPLEAGAKVENCVIMNDTVVGENSLLKYVILDKDVVVRPGSKLIGTPSNPIIIKRGEIV